MYFFVAKSEGNPTPPSFKPLSQKAQLHQELENRETELQEAHTEIQRLKEKLEAANKTMDKQASEIKRLELNLEARPLPKNKADGPIKPYSGLSRQGKGLRIQKIADTIFTENDILSCEDIEDVFQKLMRKYGHSLPSNQTSGFHPTTTRTPKEERIDAMVDLKMMSHWKLSWRQRELIKRDLIEVGKDFFCATNLVRRLAKELSSMAEYKTLPPSLKIRSHIRVCTNIKQYLETRLVRLVKNGSLLLGPPFNDTIFLCIGGDKGSSLTKLLMFIVNINHSNTINNMMLLGLFEGEDNGENVRAAFGNVQTQLNELKDGVIIQATFHRVKLFAVGDMKWLCSTFGHMGAASSYPCLLCKADHDQVTRSVGRITPRTIVEMTQQGVQFEKLLSATNRTLLSKQFQSIDHPPLFSIEVNNIVPSPLHIILGLGGNLIDSLEREVGALDDSTQSTTCSPKTGIQVVSNLLKIKRKKKTPEEDGSYMEKLQTAYKEAGVDRLTRHHRFVGELNKRKPRENNIKYLNYRESFPQTTFRKRCKNHHRCST